MKESHALGSTKKKPKRVPSLADVGMALFQRFTAVRAQSIPISGKVMKARAERLAVELDPTALAHLGGCHNKRKDTTSSIGVLVVRMLQYISLCVTTGSNLLFSLFCSVTMLAMCSVLTRQVCSDNCCQIKHMQQLVKCAQVEKIAKGGLLCLSVRTWMAQKSVLCWQLASSSPLGAFKMSNIFQQSMMPTKVNER